MEETSIVVYVSLIIHKNCVWLDPGFLSCLGGGIWGLMAERGRWVLPVLRRVTGRSRPVSLHFARVVSLTGCQEYGSATSTASGQWVPRTVTFSWVSWAATWASASPRQPDYLCCSLICSLSPQPPPQHVLACPWHVKYLRKHLTKLWQIQWNSIKTQSRPLLLLPCQPECCLWSQRILPGRPGRGPTAAGGLRAK